jgi:hypothetical protein
MHIHKIRSKINKSNLIYTQCLLMSMYTRYIPSYFCSHLRSQPDIFKRDNIVVHQLWRDFSAGWQVGSPLLWAHISVWTAHMQHFPLFAAAAPIAVEASPIAGETFPADFSADEPLPRKLSSLLLPFPHQLQCVASSRCVVRFGRSWCSAFNLLLVVYVQPQELHDFSGPGVVPNTPIGYTTLIWTLSCWLQLVILDVFWLERLLSGQWSLHSNAVSCGSKS